MADTLLHIDQSGELKLEQSLSLMYAWVCSNGLAINPDESEAILLVHVDACVLCLLASTSQALLQGRHLEEAGGIFPLILEETNFLVNKKIKK